MTEPFNFDKMKNFLSQYAYYVKTRRKIWVS